MRPRMRSPALISMLLGAAVFVGGCDGCNRREERRDRVRTELEPARGRSCATSTDCQDQDPCTRHECIDELCVVSLAPRGTSCDNDTLCDGLSTCDQNGRCVAGAPPLVDDGNPCTIDSCDPKRGVLHESVPVDDFDACTNDTCDPGTGQIAHTTLAIDDGNDCTVDSCHPQSGVKHEQPNGVYTCEGRCETGFHVASRTQSRECGSPQAFRSFCAPNCGASFYTCEPSCPTGYQRRAASAGGNCGNNPPLMLFCVKG
jgi:hypothetical protein